MTYFIGLAVLVALVAVVAGRKTVARFFTAIGAQVSKLGRAAVAADPIAVYQKQVDDATDELREGTKGLEQYRGLVLQLERRIESDEKEIAVYDARARGFVASGDDVKASAALMSKEKLEKSCQMAKSQLAQYDAAYKASLKKIQFAQGKIQEAKDNARRLSAELKMSRAESEIALLAQSFNTNSSNLTKLGETEDLIQQQIDSNRAKAQVVADLGNDGLADIEAEERARTASAADALAKLKAEMSAGS